MSDEYSKCHAYAEALKLTVDEARLHFKANDGRSLELCLDHAEHLLDKMIAAMPEDTRARS